jgi:hypothetical protein
MRVMSAAKPRVPAKPERASRPTDKSPKRGLPGTERERIEQRRRFAKEHRETLRRLGK